MNTKEFLKHIEKTFKDCLTTAKLKNQDYANSDNPFKNFEMSLQVGVNVDRAILVRTSDKLSRISNLLDRDASVKDERLEDTIDDAINYLAILKAYKSNN
jgi:type IV secretory pathway TrbF-like protein